jgi:hypothetical protein
MSAKQAKVAVETTIHEDGGHTHTMRFTNGQTRTISVAPDHVLYPRYAAQGSKGKFLAAANSAGDADEAIQKVDALVDAADEGKWSLLGEGGPKFTPLVRALAELKGIEPSEAAALVKGLSKSDQAKLRGTSRIAGLIAKYKAEQENDGDSLLAGLLKEDEAEADDASERVA